jgi:hypothetical protein
MICYRIGASDQRSCRPGEQSRSDFGERNIVVSNGVVRLWGLAGLRNSTATTASGVAGFGVLTWSGPVDIFPDALRTAAFR